MKLGAENKKATYALGVLLVLLAYFMYSNLLSGPSTPSAPAPAPVARFVAPPSISRADPPDAPSRPSRSVAEARNSIRCSVPSMRKSASTP